MNASANAEVTRPDKLLWPALGITKQAYVDYLNSVSELMLPWLRDRPLTLVRAPDGVDGERYRLPPNADRRQHGDEHSRAGQ